MNGDAMRKRLGEMSISGMAIVKVDNRFYKVEDIRYENLTIKGSRYYNLIEVVAGDEIVVDE